MFYLSEEKRLLGRYFHYIRKEKGISLTTIYQKNICGHGTISDIEKGIIKKNDDYYDSFIELYSLNYVVDNQKFNKLIHSTENLYEACESLDKSKIEEEINNINHSLINMKQYHVYNEYLKCLEYINRHYIKDENLTKDELLEIIKYIKLWNNKLSSILTEIVEKNNRNYLLDQELFDKMKPLYNQKDAISSFWYADNQKNVQNYIVSLDVYKKLYSIFKEKNYVIRKLQTTQALFSIYRDTDIENATKYLLEIQSILQDDSIPVKTRNACYYNLGMYYYLNYNYEKAYENFNNAYRLISKEKTILFICACKRRLGYKIEKFDLDENHSLYPYLKYFSLISNGTPESKLEDYIMNNLLNILKDKKYIQPFWAMFQFEIIQLSKITKNYSKVVIFQEKLAKATKSTV